MQKINKNSKIKDIIEINRIKQEIIGKNREKQKSLFKL